MSVSTKMATPNAPAVSALDGGDAQAQSGRITPPAAAQAKRQNVAYPRSPDMRIAVRLAAVWRRSRRWRKPASSTSSLSAPAIPTTAQVAHVEGEVASET